MSLPILSSPAISSVERRKPSTGPPCSQWLPFLADKGDPEALKRARDDARCRPSRQHTGAIFPGLL